MDITPPIHAGRQVIQGYGGGGFRISEQRWTGPVIVLPEQTHAWPVESLEKMSSETLSVLQSHEPAIELLLLGCGARIAQIDAGLRQSVRDWGIVIETMDTGAACRTFNVLLSEERRVAAALLPVA